ncbi:MAG: TIGR04295 family B12-binding domain-containing radical SAM protein [Caulobacteraceae bacterium]
MRVALVNPAWSFEQSIYFGCRHEHLPLELGCCRVLLEAAGHQTLMLDGALMGLDNAALADQVAAFAPDMTVVTTAPTYLFWRCTQPELRVPRAFLDGLAARGGMTVAVGPHASATPETALRKLGCDLVVRGECEEIVAELADAADPYAVRSTAHLADGVAVITGAPAATRFTDLPALHWPAAWLQRHGHHHHRYGTEAVGFGAEVEASRGCPYHCSFCAKIDFRDQYRRRDLAPVLEEIDALISAGVTYIYFVDEIFLPQKALLEALVERPVQFGVQTRIDLWKPDMLDLLGAAGCVSIEAGVESLTEEGRDALDKRCRMTTDELAERLIHARRTVPFVQANLLEVADDDAALVTAWRERLLAHGVWANDPVPLYPYPSSPDYRKLWGLPDGRAWERAHEHYLAQFDSFSDIQEERPLPLPQLEAACCL